VAPVVDHHHIIKIHFDKNIKFLFKYYFFIVKKNWIFVNVKKEKLDFFYKKISLIGLKTVNKERTYFAYCFYKIIP
jgi:hypothetical protein